MSYALYFGISINGILKLLKSGYRMEQRMELYGKLKLAHLKYLEKLRNISLINLKHLIKNLAVLKVVLIVNYCLSTAWIKTLIIEI